MADLKYTPVAHNHKDFLEKASKRKGFPESYEAQATAHALAHAMLSARMRTGLTQEAVADRMGTTKARYRGWEVEAGMRRLWHRSRDMPRP